ncbi:hypothetical protein FAVG1_06889 [Fusarium avenaceum]|nr:hypothetical protein FAVG1_06889 [Fusarium avenaceum]
MLPAPYLLQSGTIPKSPDSGTGCWDRTIRYRFRYLWVDALCIIQDDEHDWQVESSKMSEVYSNAYCTISASGAKDTSEGCFLERSGSALPLQPGMLHETDFSKQMSELALIPSVPQWEVAVRNAPLNYRLWALQERALSHRIMHWTKNELFWECGEGYASESYPCGLPSSSDCHSKHDTAQPVSEAPAAFQEIIQALPSEDAVLRQWYLIAMEASRRSLTESSDMLPALSGLAHIIHQRTKDQYLAGLWRRDLPRSLFWRRGDGWPPKKRLQSYRAPSWSWASVVDSVVFPGFGDHALHDFAPDITLVEENVQLVGVDPFGQHHQFAMTIG